jgi:hypothetical protein
MSPVPSATERRLARGQAAANICVRKFSIPRLEALLGPVSRVTPVHTAKPKCAKSIALLRVCTWRSKYLMRFIRLPWSWPDQLMLEDG